MNNYHSRMLLALVLCFRCGWASPASLPEDGMFHLYENNRRTRTPNFITTDFMLLAYSMVLQEALVASERDQAYPELREILHGLSRIAASAKVSEPQAEAAVRGNRQFLSVLVALIDGQEPANPEKEVSAELALVRGARETQKSPIFHETVDYTQFRPRGFYTRSPELSRYFQAVRYGSAIGFYVQESASTGIDLSTADQLGSQALLLSKWIVGDPAIRDRFHHLEERQSWLFGPSDDVASTDLLKAAGSGPQWRKNVLAEARRLGHQPAIYSGLIDTSKLEPGLEAKDALTAWRLLPGSFTPDGAAQQRLVYSNVGRYFGKGNPVSLTTVNGLPVKGFPLATEIMGLLGSEEAQRVLHASEETNYEGYEKAHRAALDEITRPSGLPGENMDLLKTVLSSRAPQDAPRQLQSALGFWTIYRHTGVLHAKQSYTATGKGIEAVGERTAAWLEPSPEVYKMLKRMSTELQTRLSAGSFGPFSNLLDQCIQISADETAGHALNSQQVAFLNGLDKELLRLTGNTDQPIAVDVHTDANSGQVLMEALKYPVEVKHGDQRGARFQTAEFKAPMTDRLTDEAWQEKLLKESSK